MKNDLGDTAEGLSPSVHKRYAQTARPRTNSQVRSAQLEMGPELGSQHNMPRTRGTASFQGSIGGPSAQMEMCPERWPQHNSDGAAALGRQSGPRPASPKTGRLGLAEYILIIYVENFACILIGCRRRG